jgi:hypothetical protein
VEINNRGNLAESNMTFYRRSTKTSGVEQDSQQHPTITEMTTLADGNSNEAGQGAETTLTDSSSTLTAT